MQVTISNLQNILTNIAKYLCYFNIDDNHHIKNSSHYCMLQLFYKPDKHSSVFPLFNDYPCFIQTLHVVNFNEPNLINSLNVTTTCLTTPAKILTKLRHLKEDEILIIQGQVFESVKDRALLVGSAIHNGDAWTALK